MRDTRTQLRTRPIPAGQLRDFEAVARHLNFSAAAQEMPHATDPESSDPDTGRKSREQLLPPTHPFRRTRPEASLCERAMRPT